MDKGSCIFFFPAIDRPWVMNPHEFYVKEARERILSQFSDIELDSQAEQKEQEFMAAAAEWFDPEAHDEGDVYERALDVGISHWVAMHDMKITVMLALTAGMYHQFDKALRGLVLREARHWTWLDKHINPDMIWNISTGNLVNLLEWVGVELKTKTFMPVLGICQQVVNVYKHGDGPAHKRLAKKFPQYYWQPQGGRHGRRNLPSYEQLQVSEEQFIQFADAITEFWKSLPEQCYESQLGKKPRWFDEECLKYD